MEACSKIQRGSGSLATLRHQVIKSALERWDKLCKEEDDGERPRGEAGRVGG